MATRRKRRFLKPNRPANWPNTAGLAWDDPGLFDFLKTGDPLKLENKWARLIQFEPEKIKLLWQHFKDEILRTCRKKPPWAATQLEMSGEQGDISSEIIDL